MSEIIKELLDQQPPSCTDLERSLLGSILLKPEVIDEVSILLEPDAFYDDANQIIYKHMLAIYRGSDPFDMATLVHSIKQSNEYERIGGAAYIAKIVQSELTAVHALFYGHKILEDYKRRQLQFASLAVYRNASDTTQPIEQVSAKAVDQISEATERGISDDIERVGESVYSLIASIESGNGCDQESITSGLDQLDVALNGGFHPGQSIVLAARPSIGKSALALSFALHAARQSTAVAFFSLEMNCEEIAERTLSNVSRISKSGFEAAVKYRGVEVNDAMLRIADIPLYISDQATITIEEIVSKIRMLKRKHGIKLAIIDYLQLIEPSNPKLMRQQQIGHISRRIKQAAQGIGVAIISL